MTTIAERVELHLLSRTVEKSVLYTSTVDKVTDLLPPEDYLANLVVAIHSIPESQRHTTNLNACELAEAFYWGDTIQPFEFWECLEDEILITNIVNNTKH